MASPLGKRAREEDDLASLEVEIQFNRKKRRILPIRTTPIITNHTLYQINGSLRESPSESSLPPALTPSDSVEDDNDASPAKNAFTFAPYHSQSPHSQSIFMDVHQEDDYDMNDALPMHSPDALGILSPIGTTTRIPTPMFGSFTRPHRHASGGRVDFAMENIDELFSSQQQERRRLPSPISELEDTVSPMSGAGAMMGRLGVEDASPVSMDGDDGSRGRERVRTSESRPARAGKPTLTMGYRADCEKCRAKVPGHYSHLTRC
ncbi:MAG: hypothetical protein M1825_001204 [Sarcosagium campestre]|nr:MAG: hypothetical protein M1825_001204 [Sarcosagium campestre]